MSNENSNPKPDCPLIGQDGNIFCLVGIAAKTLRENGLSVLAYEMSARVYDSGSYDEALGIIGEYVNITSVDDPHENFEMEELT
ncbi:MAG: hypothetical protein K2N56_04375 [Oscillospiraceae bacterium]|nr:hypothetical protein [Oscillospiraceae bacterium]